MTEIDLEPIEGLPVTGETEEAAERFDPVEMKGELIEAEHLARYRLASGLAQGRRVLDAGCGWGYGSNLLAANAESVIGIDVEETVIEAAGVNAAENVTLQIGDVSALEFADDSFDLVVCFEVIEHIEERDRAIEEFARVLAPGGLLLISSPNRDIYGDRNPYHVFEYTPEEFRQFIASQFEHQVQLVQENWITSMISTLETFTGDTGVRFDNLDLIKTVGRGAAEATYLVAVASRDPLPENIAETAVMTFNTELLKWNELWELQDAYLRDLEGRLTALSWDTVVEIDRRLSEHEAELIAAAEREHHLVAENAVLRGESLRAHLVRSLKTNRLLRKLTGKPPLP